MRPRRARPTKLHPVEKALIRQRWSAEAVQAQIHALIGQDREKLLAHGSVMLFVASACALAMKWTGDEPDMRIVRATVNTLDDLKGRGFIAEQDRASIHSGLMAASRVIAAAPAEVVHEAAWLYADHSRGWEAQQ